MVKLEHWFIWSGGIRWQLTRAAVELAKAWRTDKFLRRLDVCLFLELFRTENCVFLLWFRGGVRLLNHMLWVGLAAGCYGRFGCWYLIDNHWERRCFRALWWCYRYDLRHRVVLSILFRGIKIVMLRISDVKIIETSKLTYSRYWLRRIICLSSCEGSYRLAWLGCWSDWWV